jgi:large repetitive protein
MTLLALFAAACGARTELDWAEGPAHTALLDVDASLDASADAHGRDAPSDRLEEGSPDGPQMDARASLDGSDAHATPPDAPVLCGNGVVDPGENCDDGNTVSGDGCDNQCCIERGYDCKSAYAPPCHCGDGKLDFGEQCDDGNSASGDGCSYRCKLEPEGTCGNGRIDAQEECDDGNTRSGDGCDPVCELEPSRFCTIACGDGMLEPGEACDDGNSASGDGCSDTCQIEPGYGCPKLGKPCVKR